MKRGARRRFEIKRRGGDAKRTGRYFGGRGS